MGLINTLVIVTAKVVGLLISIGKLGAGATWPGEIALRLQPGLLKTFGNKGKTIIVVAGTNGKTTTVKLLDTILRANHVKICRNASGANLANGVLSTFIADSTFWGTLRSDTFIFEVDEAALPGIISAVNPRIVILLNLFRDQLDRYGEVDAIAAKWAGALNALPKDTYIAANADDPHIALLTRSVEANVEYFGLEDPSLFLTSIEHATDTIYCPDCGHRLTFTGVYFSHLGKWACGKCKFIHPEVKLKASDVKSPVEGVYNIYNTLAACLAARHTGIGEKDIVRSLSSFTPAFGRMEKVCCNGVNCIILLSKNPTGFNESLRTILKSDKKGPLLLVLNDRIPDGRDISWIWDVDFEMLKAYRYPIILAGDRGYELGIRLAYISDRKPQKAAFQIFEDLPLAVGAAKQSVKPGETLWILATYTAMLEVRGIMTGRKIL